MVVVEVVVFKVVAGEYYLPVSHKKSFSVLRAEKFGIIAVSYVGDFCFWLPLSRRIVFQEIVGSSSMSKFVINLFQTSCCNNLYSSRSRLFRSFIYCKISNEDRFRKCLIYSSYCIYIRLMHGVVCFNSHGSVR